MKGAKQLCGMFDNNNKAKRICVSCKCAKYDLDDPYTCCESILHEDMYTKIIHHSEEELRLVSQHKLVNNAFFDVDIGGWKYGIWGLCPSEILHQFYEGLVKYALEYFFKTVLTDGSRNNLIRDVDDIISLSKGQSDRDFPQVCFVMGVTSYAKLSGIEKFNTIFYLCIYLCTSRIYKLYDGCTAVFDKDAEIKFKKWQKLFQTMVFYRDWLMKENHNRFDVEHKKYKMVIFMKQFKSVVKREAGAKLKIPKYHELLHICRDILRHGPPRGYDTCPVESNHRPLKALSQNTQRIKSRFEKQTADRLFEDNIMYTAWKDCGGGLSKGKQTMNISYGHYFLKYGSNYNGSNHNLEFINKDNETPLSNTVDFEPELLSFLENNLGSKLENSNTLLNCYSTYKRDGNIFYGCSRDNYLQRQNPSWAIFKWINNNNIETYVPGKCICFIDMREVRFENNDALFPSELHVVIQSLTGEPKLQAENKPRIADRMFLTDKPKYYIVSVNTISETAFVITDKTEENPNQYLYLYPRREWKDKF